MNGRGENRDAHHQPALMGVVCCFRYAGLAHAPMFVAKLIAGWMSGELLHAFCPEVQRWVLKHRVAAALTLGVTLTEWRSRLLESLGCGWRGCAFISAPDVAASRIHLP